MSGGSSLVGRVVSSEAAAVTAAADGANLVLIEVGAGCGSSAGVRQDWGMGADGLQPAHTSGGGKPGAHRGGCGSSAGAHACTAGTQFMGRATWCWLRWVRQAWC